MSKKEKHIIFWDEAYFNKCLQDANMSINDLADQIGIHVSNFSKYRCGAHNPSKNVIEKIVEILHCDEEILLKKNKKFWNEKYFQQMREKRKMSLQEVADKVGINVVNFHYYKNGSCVPSNGTITKICDVLKADSNLLIVKNDQKYKKMNLPETTEDTQEEPPILSEIDTITDSTTAEEMEKKELKLISFSDTNVINNLNIMNENIILASKMILEENSSLKEEINLLKEQIDSLKKDHDVIVTALKLLSMKNEEKEKEEKQEKQEKSIEEDLDFLQKCQTSSSLNMSSAEFRDNVFAMVKYIGRKKNLIFKQVLCNLYKEFLNIYGINVNDLKKNYKEKNNLEAIYENELYRDIFYNMLVSKL